jgi:hypothetical protein
MYSFVLKNMYIMQVITIIIIILKILKHYIIVNIRTPNPNSRMP